MVCLTAENSIIRQTPMFLERKKSAQRKEKKENLRLLVVHCLSGPFAFLFVHDQWEFAIITRNNSS